MVNAPVVLRQTKDKPLVEQRWWHDGISLLQLYPASYKDSNGDGVGDLPGIISKLDYIKSLGVDGLWLCPHHKSPRVDEGYDISDYQDVHDKFGTLEDCQRLIDEAHARGLKVLFDLVINHCSDQHPWFTEARTSKDSPKRDWFHWQPPKIVDGQKQPPNNWRTCFGGSAWQYDEGTDEYYLHYFCPEQPDWNWENPEVRAALYENAILFWLERGVDGFRIDTVNMYSKPGHWKDAPIVDKDTPYQPNPWMCNGPRLSEYLQEMYANTFAHYDTFTLGELPNTPSLEKILQYTSRQAKQLDSTILFDLMNLDHGGRWPLMPKTWKLSSLKSITEFAQQQADPKHNGHALTFLENHDQARCVSRYASDAPEYRVASAKLLATYLLTLSGSIVIYEGQEIGMINAPKDWDIKEYIDVNTINMWREVQEEVARTGDKSLLETATRGIQLSARDHSRTPMHWDDSTSAGFSTSSKTWYRVMESYKEGINVAAQEGDPSSPLNFYRRMMALRKEHADVFIRGLFKLYDPENESTMIYSKTSLDGKRSAVVALNFTDKEQSVALPSELQEGSLIVDTASGSSDGKLAPYGARVYISA